MLQTPAQDARTAHHQRSYGLSQSATISLATCDLAAECSQDAKQMVAAQQDEAVFRIIRKRSNPSKINDVWDGAIMQNIRM
jgi:hypothetical protein